MKERAKQTRHDGTNVAVASPRAMAVADDGTLFVADAGAEAIPASVGDPHRCASSTATRPVCAEPALNPPVPPHDTWWQPVSHDSEAVIHPFAGVCENSNRGPFHTHSVGFTAPDKTTRIPVMQGFPRPKKPTRGLEPRTPSLRGDDKCVEKSL